MKKREFQLTKKCDHVAFIMDGNGRWAKLRGLPRYIGHHEGCNRVLDIFEACREFGIRVMTFYAFSTENWNRPADEITHIQDILEEFFTKQMDYLDSVGAHIMVSGDLSRFRPSTRNVCEEAIARTAKNDRWVLNVCLNYGGRDEIVRAAKAFAEEVKEGKKNPDDLNEALFKTYLYTKDLPDVDLMIRSSGEQRLSNFMLYENAYAEFVFTPVKWPDFDREALIDCLEEYQTRDRRFGGLKNE